MLLFLLFLRTTPSMNAIGHAAWLLLGFVATGVATFNLASWSAFYGARLWTRGRPVAKTAAWTVGGAMAVLNLTIVVHAALSILLNGEKPTTHCSLLAALGAGAPDCVCRRVALERADVWCRIDGVPHPAVMHDRGQRRRMVVGVRRSPSQLVTNSLGSGS